MQIKSYNKRLKEVIIIFLFFQSSIVAVLMAENIVNMFTLSKNSDPCLSGYLKQGVVEPLCSLDLDY